MWNLPRPGHEPVSLALTSGLSTTAPPGKPGRWILNHCATGEAPAHFPLEVSSEFSLGWWWPCGVEVEGAGFCRCWPRFRCGSYLALLLLECLWPCHGFHWLSGPCSASSSFCLWAPLGPLRVLGPPVGWVGSGILDCFLPPHWVVCTLGGCVYLFFIMFLFLHVGHEVSPWRMRPVSPFSFGFPRILSEVSNLVVFITPRYSTSASNSFSL